MLAKSRLILVKITSKKGRASYEERNTLRNLLKNITKQVKNKNNW